MEHKSAPLAQGGQRHTFTREDGTHLAAVIRLPGTMSRIFWADGTVDDFASLDEAIERVRQVHKVVDL